MCVTSNVGDYYKDKWTIPWKNVLDTTSFSTSNPEDIKRIAKLVLENAEKDGRIKELEADLKEARRLLEMAKEIDEKTKQKDCEIGDKYYLLIELAEYFDIDIASILKDEIQKKIKK